MNLVMNLSKKTFSVLRGKLKSEERKKPEDVKISETSTLVPAENAETEMKSLN
jgi:hypothetical protein